MINLFLDDKRIPSMSHNKDKGLGDDLSWVIVRDYFEFVDFVIENFNNINIISFDHDLACYRDNVEFTGKTAADFLINYCLDNDKKLPDWYVHSDNTSGKKNIIGVMLNYLKNIEGIDISKFRYYHNGIINNLFV
jgi:hypothetical protein